MKTYCPNCGSGMSYSGAKPKFCSSCGSPLSALAKQENKNYKIHEDVEVEEFEDEEMENVDFSSLTKLDVEIEKEQPKSSFTLGQVMENSIEVEGDIKMTKINNNSPQQSSEDFFKEFQQEAGSLRNKDA